MLYEKTLYSAPYQYLINRNIQEYDISKANISILLDMGYIKKEDYDYLYNLPKHQREIKVGLMMRSDQNMIKVLNHGFIKARQLFFEQNSINDMNVLYIDKDSITLIDTSIKTIQVSDHIKFVPKSSYTSLYRLGQIDFLYFNNGRDESYRFKYVNQEMLEKYHAGFFIDFLLFIAEEAQIKSSVECINIVRNFYNQYVSKSLDIRYYREFNQICKYKVLNSNYYLEVDDSSISEIVDISYNARVIQDIYKVLCNEYFKER
jgi:hypothetical protein